MKKKVWLLLFFCFFFTALFTEPETIYASDNPLSPSSAYLINISIGGTEAAESQEQTAAALQALFLLSIIILSPSILLMMTCFPRWLISLHFVRNALGTQQMPPNQILIALALFLSMFLMRNEIADINENALQPFSSGDITQEEAIDRAMTTLRSFMVRQVRQGHIDFFAGIAGESYSKDDPGSIPSSVLIPAFMVGELTAGFIIGVLIFVPFIVIDMVVASTLMAMGMMMLPPAMISLPFKILLFILVDGWTLVLSRVFETFR